MHVNENYAQNSEKRKKNSQTHKTQYMLWETLLGENRARRWGHYTFFLYLEIWLQVQISMACGL